MDISELKAIRERANKAVDLLNEQRRTDCSSHSLIQLGWDIKKLLSEIERLTARAEKAEAGDSECYEMSIALAKQVAEMLGDINKLRIRAEKAEEERDAAVEDSRLSAKMVDCPKGFRGTRDTRYICPSCKKAVRNDESYCHKCGQAILFPKQVYDKENNKIWLDFGYGAERSEDDAER